MWPLHKAVDTKKCVSVSGMCAGVSLAEVRYESKHRKPKRNTGILQEHE